MCRWNSGLFYKHPALENTQYYWRVEPNVHFFCDVDYDVFRYMQDNNKTYGFTVTLYDAPKSIPTLWPETTKFLAQHREDRETREATRKEKYSQNARMEQSFKEMSEQQRAVPQSFSRANRADRYKYMDEDNSEDEEEKRIEAEKEDRIAFNQERMLGMTKQLNTLARGLGEEVSSSNKLIDEIGSKVCSFIHFSI